MYVERERSSCTAGMKAFKRARREGKAWRVHACAWQAECRRREEEGRRMFGALIIVRRARQARHRTTRSLYTVCLAVCCFLVYQINALLLELACFTRLACISYRAASGSRLPGICARPASRGEPVFAYCACHTWTTKHLVYPVPGRRNALYDE